MFVTMWNFDSNFFIAVTGSAVNLAVTSSKDLAGDINGEFVAFIAKLSACLVNIERIVAGFAWSGMCFEVVKRPVFVVAKRP